MVQPLLKWVGNKRKVAKEIISYFPDSFNNYYEPFVGSGAILIELLEANLDSLLPRFNNAYASDNDKFLIEIFNYVKNDPDKLKKYYKDNTTDFIENKKDNYSKIRDRFNNNRNGLDLLLLSRTCFGGIIRFRKSDGAMSTPVGSHNPISSKSFNKRVDEWHNLFKNNVNLETMDYKIAMARAKKGDVIYCDPPYTHSQGILYGAQSFNIQDFWEAIANAKSRGVEVFVSLNGSRNSSKTDISETPPNGLFTKIIDVSVGKSMIDRFQNKGKKMKNSEVIDKLMIT